MSKKTYLFRTHYWRPISKYSLLILIKSTQTIPFTETPI